MYFSNSDTSLIRGAKAAKMVLRVPVFLVCGNVIFLQVDQVL